MASAKSPAQLGDGARHKAIANAQEASAYNAGSAKKVAGTRQDFFEYHEVTASSIARSLFANFG